MDRLVYSEYQRRKWYGEQDERAPTLLTLGDVNGACER